MNKEEIILFIPVIPYVVLVTLLVPIDYGFDATRFVELAEYYSQTWALLDPTASVSDQSPPLRYLLYSMLLAIFKPSHSVAFRISTLYAGSVTFTGLLLSTYWLYKRATSNQAAVAAVIVVYLLFITNWPGTRFFEGKWQYSATYPFLIAATVTAHQSITDDRSVQYGILTGVLLGFTGLQQLIFGGLGSFAIGVTYLKNQEWDALTSTGLVGGLSAVPLILMKPEAKTRATTGVIQNFLPDRGGVFYDISSAISILTSPGVLLIVTLLLSFLIVEHKLGSIDETGIVKSLVMIFALAWSLTKFTRLEDYLLLAVVFPLIHMTSTGLICHFYQHELSKRFTLSNQSLTRIIAVCVTITLALLVSLRWHLP